MWKTIKYHMIVAWATITNRTVVNFFGQVYIVSGNVVKRFG